MTNVLDHGYVLRIETWGSDERIIEAARMSTGKGFNGWEPGQCPECNGDGVVNAHVTVYAPETRQERVDAHTLRIVPPAQTERRSVTCTVCDGRGKVRGDKHLLRFLWENKHATPFEMAGATFEIKAPIFVFREWHRHRTQSYNEMSARYAQLPDENYLPSVERLMLGSDRKNRQAGTIPGATALTEADAVLFQHSLAELYSAAERLYQSALAMGVPKELARVHLPVGRYSRMRASANLRNWLAFCALRTTKKNPAAQWEIRQYADALHDMLAESFPRTLALFDGRCDETAGAIRRSCASGEPMSTDQGR